MLIELVNILFGASCGIWKRSFAAGNREAGRTMQVHHAGEDGMSKEVHHSPSHFLSLTLMGSSLGGRTHGMHLCLNLVVWNVGEVVQGSPAREILWSGVKSYF